MKRQWDNPTNTARVENNFLGTFKQPSVSFSDHGSFGESTSGVTVSLLAALPDVTLYCRKAITPLQESFVLNSAMRESSVKTPHFTSLVNARNRGPDATLSVTFDPPASGCTTSEADFPDSCFNGSFSSASSCETTASSAVPPAGEMDDDCCSPAQTQFFEARNPRFRLYTSFDGSLKYPGYIIQLIAHCLKLGLLPNVPNQVLISQFLHPEHNRPVSKPTCGEFMLAIMLGSHTVLDFFPMQQVPAQPTPAAVDPVRVLMMPGAALLVMDECFRNVAFGICPSRWDVVSSDGICNMEAAGVCEGMRLERSSGVLITMIGQKPTVFGM